MPHSVSKFDFWVASALSLLLPERVCDIGAGAGKYGKIMREVSYKENFKTHITAYEVDQSYIEEFNLKEIYDEVINEDAIHLLKNPRVRFDVVMLGDCIEHMRKSEALDLINFLFYRTGYICIITPDGYVQDDVDGHAAEAHISIWSKNDFTGFDVLHKSQKESWGEMNLFLIRGLQGVRMRITG